MASSTASTVLDDGAEECYWCDCKILTTKRFQCILGHKVWMCSDCHSYRPVCPVATKRGTLCRLEDDDYKTDTDLGSGPESPFAEMQVGKYYAEVLSKVNRRKADFELDAMARITFGGEKREALRDLRKGMRRFVKELVFYKFPANSVKTSSEQLFLEVKEVNAPGFTGISWVYSDVEVTKSDFVDHIRTCRVTFC